MLNRAILLALLTASLHFGAALLGSLGGTPALRSDLALKCNEPEECMALGIKIPFRLVDQYALQLIPGIGEELAAEIVYQRRVVCADLRARPSEVSKALTKVKGVGPVIARSLIATIDFSPLEGCKLH